MQPGDFPRIADYGFLSDCHTGALVAPDGAIEWLCLPRFDSPTVFGATLDRGAGRFRIGPREAVPVARRYQPGTNILETTWATRTGWLVVIDALTIGPWRPRNDDPHTRPPPDLDAECVLVRAATCVQGEVPVELTCHPIFDYARVPPEWELAEDRHTAMATAEGQPRLVLTTDLNLGIEIQRAEARHLLSAGESCFAALAWSADPLGPTTSDEAFARLEATASYWRRWLATGDFPDHPWRIHLQRSALTLKGLTYSPTGAQLAALTTSLPETPGVSATGTTASTGSATRPSPSGRCTCSGSTRRPTTSPASSATSATRTATGCRSCTGSAASASSPRARSTTSPATAARGPCGSATAPSTSARTTSTARSSTRSTSTRAPTGSSRRSSGRSSPARSKRRRRSGPSPTRGSGRPAARPSTTSRRS